MTTELTDEQIREAAMKASRLEVERAPIASTELSQPSSPDAAPDSEPLIEVITSPDGSIAGVRRNEGKGRYTWLRWVRYVGTAPAAPDAQRKAREHVHQHSLKRLAVADALRDIMTGHDGAANYEILLDALESLAAAKAGERR